MPKTATARLLGYSAAHRAIQCPKNHPRGAQAMMIWDASSHDLDTRWLSHRQRQIEQIRRFIESMLKQGFTAHQIGRQLAAMAAMSADEVGAVALILDAIGDLSHIEQDAVIHALQPVIDAP